MDKEAQTENVNGVPGEEELNHLYSAARMARLSAQDHDRLAGCARKILAILREKREDSAPAEAPEA